MSYSRRASFADFQRPELQRSQAQIGRARAVSDAALIGRRPFEKKSYYQPNFPQDYMSSNIYEDHPTRLPSQQRRESNADGNGMQRRSCLKRNSLSYHANPNEQSAGQPGDPQQQRRRSVHFQMPMVDDYMKSQQTQTSARNTPPWQHELDKEYGFAQDDSERNRQHTPSRAQSRRNSGYNDGYPSGLPPPATEPQHPAGEVPTYVILPQKEKKPGLASKIKDAFVQVSTNTGYVALGCKPGQPTPLDIFFKEEAEERLAQAKRMVEIRKHEEEVALRKLEECKARVKAERAAGGGQFVMQTPGRKSKKVVKPSPKTFTSRRGPEYNAWLAEEYARRNQMYD